MKLPVVSGEKPIKAFLNAGFVKVRQRGSHVRLEKIEDNDTNGGIHLTPVLLTFSPATIDLYGLGSVDTACSISR